MVSKNEIIKKYLPGIMFEKPLTPLWTKLHLFITGKTQNKDQGRKFDEVS